MCFLLIILILCSQLYDAMHFFCVVYCTCVQLWCYSGCPRGLVATYTVNLPRETCYLLQNEIFQLFYSRVVPVPRFRYELCRLHPVRGLVCYAGTANTVS